MSEGIEEPRDVYCKQKEAKQFKLSLGGFLYFFFFLSLKTSPCSLQSALMHCQSKLNKADLDALMRDAVHGLHCLGDSFWLLLSHQYWGKRGETDLLPMPIFIFKAS